VNTSEGRRRRRLHSAEFKAKVVAACGKPGVSIAAIALANKLNANLLRRWVVEAEHGQSDKKAVVPVSPSNPFPADTPAFVPISVEQPGVKTERAISIEGKRPANPSCRRAVDQCSCGQSAWSKFNRHPWSKFDRRRHTSALSAMQITFVRHNSSIPRLEVMPLE